MNAMDENSVDLIFADPMNATGGSLVTDVKYLPNNSLPFGASLSIDEVELISSKKQLLIYLAGPLSILFNLIWIFSIHHRIL